MTRILLDTNVLVAAAYNAGSASRKIVEAVEQEKLLLIVSPAIVREYETILAKAVRFDKSRNRLLQLAESATSVTPQENPPVTEDRTDDKYLSAALAGGAGAIVTSDQHLLAVHPYKGIDILKPVDFWRRVFDGGGGSGTSSA